MDLLGQILRARTLSLISLGRKYGLAEPAMLADTGIELTRLSDPQLGVTVEQELQVARNVINGVPPSVPVPLDAGLDFYLISTGELGEALRTASTGGEALALYVDWLNSVPLSTKLEAVVEGQVFRLRFDNTQVPADLRVFHTIRSMVLTSMSAREILGEPVPPREVSMNAPRPAYADAIDRFAGVNVRWDAEHAELTADLHWLTMPLDGDPDAHLRAVEAVWRIRDPRDHRGRVSEAVREVLTSTPEQLGAAAVAARLRRSARTLRRQLAAEGHTFRELAAALRQGLAEDLLTAGFTVTQVADRLGYADTSAFTRAFRRHHGVAPDAWRRRNRGES